MNENDIGTKIVRIFLDIHRNLGPGLLESVYETILYHELRDCGCSVQNFGAPLVKEGITRIVNNLKE